MSRTLLWLSLVLVGLPAGQADAPKKAAPPLERAAGTAALAADLERLFKGYPAQVRPAAAVLLDGWRHGRRSRRPTWRS